MRSKASFARRLAFLGSDFTLSFSRGSFFFHLAFADLFQFSGLVLQAGHDFEKNFLVQFLRLLIFTDDLWSCFMPLQVKNDDLLEWLEQVIDGFG